MIKLRPLNYKDEIVLCGFAVLLTFLFLAIYNVVILRNPFSLGEFGGASAAVLTAIGGGQGVREWLTAKGGTDAEPRHD
jgi:hypothetical protein